FHAEVSATVLDVHVELLEGDLIHQQIDAFAGGQLAALVLRFDARLAPAETSFRPPALQFVENFLHLSAAPRLQPNGAARGKAGSDNGANRTRPPGPASNAGGESAAMHRQGTFALRQLLAQLAAQVGLATCRLPRAKRCRS